ncbi:hypothetical protein GQ42DRAFT_168449 [Ramicandelaber brevisporus]|nr:hypothetical protein GQ42DRAFT_168449 [Ramicandelaber brevisporus]
MPETFKPLTQQVGTSGIDSLVTCGCRATYRLADLLAENKHNCARQLSPRKICNAPLLKSVQGVMVPRLRGGCLTALAVAERVVLFDELVLELRRNPQPACTRCGHVYSVYEGDGVSEMVLNDMGEYDLLDVKAAWFSDGSSSNKRSKIFSDILTILTSRAQFVMNEELRIRFSIVLNGPTVDAGDTHIQALAPLFKELAEGVECRFFDGRKCVFRLEVVSICGDRPALSTIFGVKSHKSTFYKCLACTGGSHNGQSARTMSLKASLTGNCADNHAECVTPLGKPIYIPKTDIQYDETLPATGFNLMKCSAKHLSYFDSHATNDSSAICVNHPGVQKHLKNITFGSMVHDPLHVIFIGLGGQCFDMAWNGLKFTNIKEAVVNEFDNIHTQTASSSEMKKSVKDQLSNATGILKKHIMAGSLLVATSAVLPDITNLCASSPLIEC